jgi:ABC-type spermidine/putrescine transport system permease subunit II
VAIVFARKHVEQVDKSLLRRPVKPPPSRLHIPAGFRVGARLVEPIYLAVISAFILLPLVVLIPVSFSSAEVLIFPPPGYSLRWFETIFVFLPLSMPGVRTATLLVMILSLGFFVTPALLGRLSENTLERVARSSNQRWSEPSI